jgi:hypothetical protein
MLNEVETDMNEYRRAWIEAEIAAAIAEFRSAHLLGWGILGAIQPIGSSGDSLIVSSEHSPKDDLKKKALQPGLPK